MLRNDISIVGNGGTEESDRGFVLIALSCYHTHMKTASAILMLTALGIAGFAMFGVAAMTHGSGHAGWCPIAVSVSDCPAPTNALAAVSFHLDGMRGFLTSTAADAFPGFLLALLGLLAISFATIRFASDRRPAIALRVLPNAAHGSFSRREARLIRWLAFHNESPAFT